MGRLIGVISAKGGVGKTTVASNLSVALAKLFHKRVTVIDCNITTSHLSLHFGTYSHPITLNNVLRDEASIEQAIFKHSTGVKIVPASLNLSDLTGVDISTLDRKFDNMFQGEDFVFLDTAPGFGKEAVSAIRACEEALIVTTPDIPAVTDVLKGKKVLEELEVKPIGIILNKVTGGNFELRDNEITQITDLPILAKIPYEKKILQSLAVKMPLVVYDYNSKTSLEFFRLAKILAGYTDESFYTPKLGFFGRLKRIFRRS